jgi:hypothetical protein
MRRRRFFRAALGALAATPLARFLPKGGEEVRDVTWTVPSSVDVTRDIVAGEPVTINYWLHRGGYRYPALSPEDLDTEALRRLAQALVRKTERNILG